MLSLLVSYLPPPPLCLILVGIMELMKDMYEDGDENMKKIIGEAMMKSQRGEQVTPDNLGV